MASRRVDVVVGGGGPAGLSAALVLGRRRREGVLSDDGNYRNVSARKMRGFSTRDHITPRELRQLAYADLARYPSPIPGLFVAGDATHGALQTTSAADDRAAAAVTINEYLSERESHATPRTQKL